MEKAGVRNVIFFLFPSLVLLAFVFGVPLLNLIYYSLATWEGINPTLPLGPHNYIALAKDLQALESLIRTLIIGGVTIPVTVIISVVVAHFLYERVFGWQFYLVVFFIPVILPVVVIGVIFTRFYMPNGLLNHILRFIGLGRFATAWLSNLKTVLPSIIIAAIWWEVAFATILFYSRMMNVNPSLYEAARIDGATEGQLVYHVTLPQLRGVIQLYFVLATIYYLNQSFTYIFVMTHGGPGWATCTIDFFIYLNAFKYVRLGIASALSLLVSVVLVFIVHIYLSMSKGEEIQ